MYAVTGATGNIGRVIVESLLERGEKVRAIGRSPERLQPLVDKGAEPVVADLTDTGAVTGAFKDCKAVYVMIPPNMKAGDFRAYQNEVGQSLFEAIKSAGVKHVVNLSSIGAQLSGGVGVVNGLHDQEERLNKLDGVNVIHLRPSFFFENHLWQIDTIKQYGLMASPEEPDRKVAQIATADIGHFAAERMSKLDFEGHFARELLGAEDCSLNDVAIAIGRQIGNENLRYQKVSFDDTRNHFLSIGASESVADGLIELYQAFNQGKLEATEARSAENSTPTTTEDFSRIFGQIYGS